MSTFTPSLKNATVLLLLAVFINISGLYAQSNEDSTAYEKFVDNIEPLLETNIPYSSFAGLSTDVVHLNKQNIVSPGVNIGIVLNHRILIGGYVNFLMSFNGLKIPESSLLKVRYEYGGLWLGYLTTPIKNIQLGISTKVGKGDLTLEAEDGTKYRNKQILTLAPQFDLHIKVTRWLWVSLSTGYRFTGDLNIGVLSNNYFNGQSTTFGVVFGDSQF